MAHDPQPDDDDQRTRTRQNLAAIVAVVLILAIGFWLYGVIAGMNRSLECIQSGRRNCDASQ